MKHKTISLPVTNDRGYYEIRLESIGGLGANLCGKLLGQLGAEYLGLNSASFSSYGSEKRGSPVRSHVRWAEADRQILTNAPITNPHMLILFHEALGESTAAAAGTDENCTVVVNSPDPPQRIREKLKLCGGTVCCIDALSLAMETKSRVNMVMLGAAAGATGFIPIESVRALVSETLGKKYPAMLENNLRGLQAGFDQLRQEHFACDGEFRPLPYREIKAQWGYMNAPIGGINPLPGSTVTNDLSPSREGYIPLFLPEKCIHCALCDTTCPDMVFQFTPGEYKGRENMMNRGLDYHHCKGCLRCVDICPTGALVAGLEREHPEKKWFVRNRDLVSGHMDFEPAGANPWVTGESYLDEKRVDGGLM